ncbi:MAG TPA: L,D-transpeptidase family protein [Alphaproteobacteria bacterium]|nr:L,D-transpeptidase family protein [Alphaproteobacteria bacterium]
MKKFLLLISVVGFLGGCAAPKADLVVVKKSKNKMYLMQDDKVLRSYNIALGGNPVGHKVQEGDQRTPEGVYMLNYKNTKSKFYKSINIDYPNEQDIARAKLRGVDPGDDIVIHGLPNELGDIRGPIEPLNWTNGCIGVRNYEMDEIWQLVEVDTPIEILP